VFVEGFRLLVALLGTGLGLALGQQLTKSGGHPTAVAVAGVLGCLFGYVVGGIGGRLTDRALRIVDARSQRLAPSHVLAGGLGGGAGIVGGLTVAIPVIHFFPGVPGYMAGALAVWICASLGVRLMVGRSDELLAMAGLSTRPLVRATPYDQGEGVLVDSSTIMDGQLATLARAGLLPGDLLVPRFVLDELQGLADGNDEARSRKAQRGLEALDALRKNGQARVFIVHDELPEFEAVDAKLAALARRLETRLITSDANLARVAEIQGVVTVNLRRVIAELAPEHASGEQLLVRLEKTGRDPDQGVGYLDDGTMVVVNGGRDLVGGGGVAVVVTSLLPTDKGRIAFARLADAASEVSA
jgi:uncharacterized protein YacL